MALQPGDLDIHLGKWAPVFHCSLKYLSVFEGKENELWENLLSTIIISAVALLAGLLEHTRVLHEN